MLSQLTVFLENKSGHLASACRTIAQAGLNMRALFLADSAEFGVARIFCDQPDQAVKELRQAGFMAKTTQVLAVRLPDQTGCLASLLEFLDEQGINLEYGYCFPHSDGYAIDVLKTDGDQVERQLALAGYQMVEANQVYQPN